MVGNTTKEWIVFFTIFVEDLVYVSCSTLLQLVQSKHGSRALDVIQSEANIIQELLKLLERAYDLPVIEQCLLILSKYVTLGKSATLTVLVTLILARNEFLKSEIDDYALLMWQHRGLHIVRELMHNAFGKIQQCACQVVEALLQVISEEGRLEADLMLLNDPWQRIAIAWNGSNL